MDSPRDAAEAAGCPIRKFPDQSLLAAPRDLSQRATSFIASQRQGIHRMPFSRLSRGIPCTGGNPRTRPAISARRTMLAPLPSGERASAARHQTSSRCQTAAPPLRRRAFVLPEPDGERLGARSPGGAAGGGERNRTDDLLLAKQALSRLSYAPGRPARRAGGPG